MQRLWNSGEGPPCLAAWLHRAPEPLALATPSFALPQGYPTSQPLPSPSLTKKDFHLISTRISTLTTQFPGFSWKSGSLGPAPSPARGAAVPPAGTPSLSPSPARPPPPPELATPALATRILVPSLGLRPLLIGTPCSHLCPAHGAYGREAGAEEHRRCADGDSRPSAAHLARVCPASPFHPGHLSDWLIHFLPWLVPYSLLPSTNKQHAGLPPRHREKPGSAGWAFPVLLALSTSLAMREQLGKTPSRLYLERGGGENASSSNFHSVAQDCLSPPTPRPAPRGRRPPLPEHGLKSSPASAQP